MADSDSQVMHFSKPAAMQNSPFLRLPPELRNLIYQICLKKDDKIVRPYDRSNVLPVSLIRLCQAIHPEAASTLYSNNVFAFVHEYEYSGDGLDDGCEIFRPLHIGAPFEPTSILDFLTKVGSNRGLVRNITLEMDFSSVTNSLSEEKKSLALFQVTEWLRPTWHFDLTEKLNITFENHDGFVQDLDAFNKVFRFLQLGSMKVKKYHQLVEEVYIKGDGSGGTICWGPRPSNPDFSMPAVYCDTVEFLTADSGLRLIPQHPKQALQLTTLPANVQYKIYGMALQQVKIDADKTSSPLSQLLYVNQELQLSRQDYVKDVNLIEITTSTVLTETTFSDFNNIRKLVRKMFEFKLPLYRDHETLAHRCRNSYLSDDAQCKLQFNLHFNVRDVMMLEDLRISILPFVMETSYFSGKAQMVISIFSEQEGKVVPGATHRIPLHTLRSRVVMALTAIIATRELDFRGVSKVWINGHGEVIDSRVDKILFHEAKPKFASKILEHGPMGPYEFDDQGVHPLDSNYRGRHWTWGGHSRSCHRSYDQFFPFTHSPNETLKYLQWVVDPDSVPREQRELTFTS